MLKSNKANELKGLFGTTEVSPISFTAVTIRQPTYGYRICVLVVLVEGNVF